MVEKAKLAVNYEAVNVEKIQAKLDSISKQIGDLRPIFAAFSNDFYNYEQRIFKLQGPGQYKDLSKKYKTWKQKEYGFTYPILKASGVLARSLSSPTGFGSINVIQKQGFLIGTSINYGIYHQSTADRYKIPHRPFIIFYGPGEGKFTKGPVAGGNMRDRWIAIMDKTVERIVTGKTTKRLAP